MGDQWRAATAPAFADLAAFVATVNANRGFFDPGEAIIAARAPGRLDLMGGIADYSGALVLELPLAAATLVAAQYATAPTITVRSLTLTHGEAQKVVIQLADLAPDGTPLSYEQARSLLTAQPEQRWAAYVAGVPLVLAREEGLELRRGLRLLIDSQVPAGKGVSSSAAIEVATMRAICELYGVTLDGRRLAVLCQMVENLVVGAPCGVMDQMTSACGEADQLLALLCQPAELQASVALPPALEVWGIDSGIRHSVSGADYGSVRVGAFMGYRIIADALGVGRGAALDTLPFGGYLANITPSLWETAYRQLLPETISGADFLARYGGTTDHVTQVDPGRTYAVRQPAAHPIYEHHRVQLFRALLGPGDPTSDGRAELLGELMFQSHASYSACGLGSDGTDRLVKLVRDSGPASGLYGAKITGGGSGGTVAVLAQRGSRERIEQLAARYAGETGLETSLIGGSSAGAMASGVLRLRGES